MRQPPRAKAIDLVMHPFVFLAAAQAAAMLPVLRVTDAASRRPVVLVGTMHYNPRSIALVREVIRREGEAGSLASVCVELCDARWNSTDAYLDRWSRTAMIKRMMVEDEFLAAAETARGFGLTVRLVDQRISDTVRRLGELTALTLSELAQPVSGWQRIGEAIGAATAQVRGGEAGLGRGALLDLGLIAGAPIALARYPISSPPVFVVLAGALITLEVLDKAIANDVSIIGLPERLLEVALAAACAALVARVAFVGLLEERNYVLARNIREACEAAPIDGDSPDTVVAVLGMAHLNGVRTLLESDEALEPSSVS